MKPKEISILIRFKTDKERHKFRIKCTKEKLTYRQALLNWVENKG